MDRNGPLFDNKIWWQADGRICMFNKHWAYIIIFRTSQINAQSHNNLDHSNVEGITINDPNTIAIFCTISKIYDSIFTLLLLHPTLVFTKIQMDVRLISLNINTCNFTRITVGISFWYLAGTKYIFQSNS